MALLRQKSSDREWEDEVPYPNGSEEEEEDDDEEDEVETDPEDDMDALFHNPMALSSLQLKTRPARKGREPENSTSTPNETEDEETETEEDDDEVFRPVDRDWSAFLETVEIRSEKLTSEDRRHEDRRYVSPNCVSKYRFGRNIAQGSQAAIFEGCEVEPPQRCDVVLRLALLRDAEPDPAHELRNHTNFQQFLRDVELRRVLTECSDPPLFVALRDVFVCNQEFGVEVLPRAAGNLADLLYQTESKRMDAVVAETLRQATQVVQKMHSCRVLHRDLSFQNFLYFGNSEQFQVAVNDFETAFQARPAEERTDSENRAFDGYLHADQVSLRNMEQELQAFGRLLQAWREGQAEQALALWDQTLNAFFKSSLEHSHPDIRQGLTEFRNQLQR